MTAVALDLTRLPVTDRASMMRELERIAVKDKTYRQTPIGYQAARFLRSLRWADASENTLESYELPLVWLARDHADFDGLERFCEPGGTEYLREFLDRHWSEAAPATKAHRVKVLRSFFAWAVTEGVIAFNPALAIRMPKARKTDRLAYKRGLLLRLITAQPSLRDQCALQFLGRMALRKDELRRLRIRDIDLARDLITVHGKGSKVVVLPLALSSLRDDLYLHVQGDERKPDEYLLHPRSHPTRMMDPSTVHRWFKRCLERADLPATIEPHELRHSAADELWRETGNIVLAQQLLRHESVGTTQDYLHPTREDLAAGLRLVEQLWTAER